MGKASKCLFNLVSVGAEVKMLDENEWLPFGTKCNAGCFELSSERCCLTNVMLRF